MHRRLARRILVTAGLLAFVLAVGTLGFVLIEHYPWFESFYMTLTTITTVGYQEMRPLSHAGRVFNSFLILLGVGAMFVVSGVITQTIVELELRDTFATRRKKRMINRLNQHFIICGFGRVGRSAAAEFVRCSAPFLLIERDEKRAAAASGAGMLTLVADASQDASLHEAGILKARGLVAALPSDAENLYIILSAKALNPRLCIVTRASEEDAREKLRRAGADIVLTPYAMAGRQLADFLLKPHVMEFLDLARSGIGASIAVEQVSIPSTGNGRPRVLGDLVDPRSSGVIVLGIRRPDGQTLFNPSPEAELSPGDYLIVIGEQASLRKLELVLAS